jgi:hypothetical protein
VPDRINTASIKIFKASISCHFLREPLSQREPTREAALIYIT